MNIFVAGISYKTAPVELRERLAVQASRVRCSGCRLKLNGGLSEVVLLSTCNRVEVYGVASKINGNIQGLFRHFGVDEADISRHLYIKQGADAVQHLMAVAGGLDSMVLGETEITGQVKQAYQAAQEVRLTGRVLNRVFQTALQAAKAIRTRTGVGRGATSVGSVAVELAERIFDRDLSDKTVMIIGAGKMGEACLRHLHKKGARSVLVTNRSFERACALADEISGKAVPFADCLDAMRQADIVVSSTGCPHTILNRSDVAAVMSTRKNRPLVLIDIAVPRDIAADVQHLDNVYLYDVDDLEVIVRENVRLREQELAHCRDLIDGQVGQVMARLSARTAQPVLPTPGRSNGYTLLQPAICPG